MTRDDIIRMAKEAGVSPVNDQQIKFEGPMWLCLERFAALVAAAERERCIEVLLSNFDIEDENIFEVAAAIRARGEA